MGGVASSAERDKKLTHRTLIIARIDEHTIQCEALGFVDSDCPRKHQWKLQTLAQVTAIPNIARPTRDSNNTFLRRVNLSGAQLCIIEERGPVCPTDGLSTDGRRTTLSAVLRLPVGRFRRFKACLAARILAHSPCHHPEPRRGDPRPDGRRFPSLPSTQGQGSQGLPAHLTAAAAPPSP